MDAVIGQEQGALDDDLVPPSSFRFWQRGRKAEHDKLMSHIVVLYKRLRRFSGAGISGDQTTGVQRLVDQALKDRSWYADGEQAHRYADSLEELVVLIADKPYLTAVMNHELSRPDPTERITLDTLFERDKIQALRRADCAEESPQPARSLHQEQMAELLRLLVQKRADQMRHERLMDRLRQFYLPRLAIYVTILLALTVFTILRGRSGPNSMHLWAELLTVISLGALGASLSGALKLRDIGELNTFRTLVTYLVVQPLIGGAFGFISWLILSSGMITVGSSSSSWRIRAVVAFAVGYSEPLFVGILGRVMGLTSPATNRAGPTGTGPSPPQSIDSSPMIRP